MLLSTVTAFFRPFLLKFVIDPNKAVRATFSVFVAGVLEGGGGGGGAGAEGGADGIVGGAGGGVLTPFSDCSDFGMVIVSSNPVT